MGAHTVTTEPVAGRVRVELGGEVLADSTNAVLLREGSLPPVTYFPTDDVSMDRLVPTDHHTTCPFKGEASYWSFSEGGESGENVAWSYLEPIEGRGDIRGHLAFYRHRVELIQVD